MNYMIEIKDTCINFLKYMTRASTDKWYDMEI